MWIEDDIWEEYKTKKAEQEWTEARIEALNEEIRDLTLDLRDCMDREMRRNEIDTTTPHQTRI